MNRDQFYARLAGIDEKQAKKLLWTLYWRGSADVRARIESLLDPAEHRLRRQQAQAVDPHDVLDEVETFVSLARAGAYLAGDRRVSPKERSRWRFTYKRLVTEAQRALVADSGDVEVAATALGLLIDLARDTRDYEFFRSEDPMQAAGVVVSAAVAVLWTQVRERRGFATFAEHAAPQLIRWESPYGWTRYGMGRVAEQETSLAEVLEGLLRAPDHWSAFARRYLDALDAVAAAEARASRPRWRSSGNQRSRRADDLAAWHEQLLDRLADPDDQPLLDRLAVHAALDGPALTFVQARLAHRRGDDDQARTLVASCLERLPGHLGFHAFARDIGAPVPARARDWAERRL
jgi:hypothetical protein